MDILTQIVLGSSLAPFALPEENPRKAMLAGGVLGAVPDFDMILGFYGSEYQELILHRSFSHAIIPFVALSFVLLWFSMKFRIFPNSSSKRQLAAFFILLLTHALLDCFTTWGTQLFWPLQSRIATQTVFVVDLIYSMPLGLAVLVYFMFYKSQLASKTLRSVLIFSGLYLLMLFLYQQMLIHDFSERYGSAKVIRANAQPGLFRPFHYRMVLERRDDFLVSKTVHSLYDHQEPDFFLLPKNNHILDAAGFDMSELRVLARGYLSVENLSADSILINDLRYGPQNPETEDYRSAFTYYLIRKNGKWKFTQNMRIADKLKVLWEKILFESGLSGSPQGR